jgi:hypothetical protein
MKGKKRGDVVESIEFTTPKSIRRVGETVSCDYKKFGFSKAKVIRVRPYFRGDLAQRIQAGRGRELPGFMNFGLFCAIMGDYVDLWKRPSEVLLAAVKKAMTDAVEHAVGRYDSTRNLPLLAKKLKAELAAYIDLCAVEAERRLDALLEQEKMPSTQNHYLWDTINKIRNQRMEDKINALPNFAVSPNQLGEPPQWKTSVIAALKSDIGNDSNESQEVQDMIDYLAAYWKLAVKRYVDEVVMTVTAALTSPKRVEEMEATLTEALMRTDDEHLAGLFCQDPRLAQRRRELVATRARMQTAKERIAAFISERLF